MKTWTSLVLAAAFAAIWPASPAAQAQPGIAFRASATAGNDAAAKSNVRNLASLVEACRADKNDYTDCNTLTDLTDGGTNPISLPYGGAAGQVEISKSKADSYDVVGHSTTGVDFTISRNKDGSLDHTCKKKDTGGCPSSGNW